MSYWENAFGFSPISMLRKQHLGSWFGFGLRRMKKNPQSGHPGLHMLLQLCYSYCCLGITLLMRLQELGIFFFQLYTFYINCLYWQSLKCFNCLCQLYKSFWLLFCHRWKAFLVTFLNSGRVSRYIDLFTACLVALFAIIYKVVSLLQIPKEGLQYHWWCSWVVSEIGIVWDDGEATPCG